MPVSKPLNLLSLSLLAYLPASATLPTRSDNIPLTTLVPTDEDIGSTDDYSSAALSDSGVAASATASTSFRVAMATTLSTGVSASASASCSSVANLNLKLAIVNSLNSNNVNAYITGLDQDNVPVYVTPSGVCQAPAPMNTTVPRWLGSDLAISLPGNNHTTNINIPGYISSGRVSIAVGELEFGVAFTGNSNSPDTPTPNYNFVNPSFVDPSDSNYNSTWGFMELTYNKSHEFFADVSYVDFVGLPVGMKLETTNDSQSFYVPGMPHDAVNTLCDKLKNEADPWDQLCIEDSNGNPLRVISPNMLLTNTSVPSSVSNSTPFGNYWTSYVNSVWQKFGNTTAPLTIDTQAAGAGNVTCQVFGDTLNCPNAGSFSKPAAEDIFGCNSGAFEPQNDVQGAVAARLCAAFNRATLLLDEGDIQPFADPSRYYSTTPNNLYSKHVHELELQGKGYAFSFDDVEPDWRDENNEGNTDNVAGIIQVSNAKKLTVYVDGMGSLG